MNRLRMLLIFLIAANWILAVGHLFLVEKMLPGPEYKVSWVGVAMITFGHLIMATALWRLSHKWAGSVLILFWSAALFFGLYEHVIQAGSNNVFSAAPNDWTGLFDGSVFALLGVEAAGLWLAIRLLGSGPNPEADASLRSAAG
jgi:hypothetical protein